MYSYDRSSAVLQVYNSVRRREQTENEACGLLPDPRPRVLDPLLIGELRQGGARKYYLIDQFDLTAAEQYLADEFAVKPEDTTCSANPEV